MLKKLATAIVIASAVTTVQLPLSFEAQAAEAKQEKKKKRPTQLVGPSVGKKVQKAFELYSTDDIDGALVLLLDIEAKKEYDKAYVARFIAVMYATKGNQEEKAISYLKQAVEPDVLNEVDHGEAIKLLADLQMQTKKYKEALKNYEAWMEFTGKEDAQTYVKIAQAYYELRRLDKMIKPADKAIALFGDKQNQNPYILKLTSYYERKMYRDGVKVLETVLQLFPENKQWWTQLGMFYLLVEDYPKALATLDMAYKQGYLVKESELKTLASLYQSNGVPFKAAKMLEKHISSGEIKRDDQTLSSLANAFHAAQNIGDAAKYYGEVAKLTNEAQHWRKQGMLLKQDEQFKNAIVSLNKALKIGVKNKGSIYMSLAESHFYLGQYKQAHAEITRAMKDPKSRKAARGWKSFIEDTARRKNVAI
ncbi:tetratricopeptide repeat protein [Thalassotalea sp. M1531]|uniref:Tetratricopeptide repeat protein n=1 Tax=Thalassotalea algicola TaxID=2716224 RepID=A0A7Y0Q8X4_9GAMM|nr:tetratricopeptide repeat protein [Thalassotalea algicola]NMP33377.1 tetratricopeptide repeat protein [Thalassotalea algicola]